MLVLHGDGGRPLQIRFERRAFQGAGQTRARALPFDVRWGPGILRVPHDGAAQAYAVLAVDRWARGGDLRDPAIDSWWASAALSGAPRERGRTNTWSCRNWGPVAPLRKENGPDCPGDTVYGPWH